MGEMVVFVNKDNRVIVIESSDGCLYDLEEFDFMAGNKIPESLREVDGYGVTPYLDMKKAFKPLKFYKIAWRNDRYNTDCGISEYEVVEEIVEIDYLNQSDNAEGITGNENKESDPTIRKVVLKKCRDENPFNVLCTSCDGVNKKCCL